MLSTYNNVFVGISLANKTLSIDSVKSIIDLALSEFKCRRLVFLIADRLDLINWRVFEHGSATTFEDRINKRSLELRNCIKEGIGMYPRKIGFIDIITWNDILNHAYWSLYMEIFSKFIEDKCFRGDLLQVAYMFASRRNKSISKSASNYLATYLIAELPTLINGIEYREKWYRSMIYPTYCREAIDDIAKKLVDGNYGAFPFIDHTCMIRQMLIE